MSKRVLYFSHFRISINLVTGGIPQAGHNSASNTAPSLRTLLYPELESGALLLHVHWRTLSFGPKRQIEDAAAHKHIRTPQASQRESNPILLLLVIFVVEADHILTLSGDQTYPSVFGASKNPPWHKPTDSTRSNTTPTSPLRSSPPLARNAHLASAKS